MAEEIIVVVEDFEDNSFNFVFKDISTGSPLWYRTTIDDSDKSHSGQGVYRNGMSSSYTTSVTHFDINVLSPTTVIEFMFKNSLTIANNYFQAIIDYDVVIDTRNDTRKNEWIKYRSGFLTTGSHNIRFIHNNTNKLSATNDIIYIDDIKVIDVVSVADNTPRDITIKESFDDDVFNFNITGTNNKWVRGVSPDGKNVLKSYPIKDSQTSESFIEIDIPDKATDILFEIKYMVSTEADFDKFTMKIDDRIIFNGYSGNISWSTYKDSSITTTGKHRITLSYKKDGSVSSGQDAVFITDVVLSYNLPKTNPVPKVIKLETNRPKISDEVGMNQSIITVRFDTDVKEYVARLNGSDATTGVLVHSGGAVKANTDAEIIVDWNELGSEGSNRINVYGLNDYGWTEYIPQ